MHIIIITVMMHFIMHIIVVMLIIVVMRIDAYYCCDANDFAHDCCYDDYCSAAY